jgi:parvulin-like peptidyl-prolyl isomerase
MMKKMLVLICMIALGFLLALTACDNNTEQSAELESVKAELEQLKAAFASIESERDSLKVKVAVEQRDRERLQDKVDELTRSCEQLQRQVEKFTFSSDQSRQQLAEIIETRDKLQEQNDELLTSHNQLSKQVEKLAESRDEAVAKARTAQKRIEMLVAMLDSENKGSGEQPDTLTITNQEQEDTQPHMIEISEFPTAPAEVSRPAAIPSQVGKRPVCHSFNTTRARIMPGQTSILSWQVSNAERILIEPDIGKVSALGSVAIKPSTATTYTLIATNKAGESRVTCRIEVSKSLTMGSD